MYVSSGHSAVRGECMCTSLVGTVQYVVCVYVTSGHSAVRGECVCMSLVGTVQYVVSVRMVNFVLKLFPAL